MTKKWWVTHLKNLNSIKNYNTVINCKPQNENKTKTVMQKRRTEPKPRTVAGTLIGQSYPGSSAF